MRRPALALAILVLATLPLRADAAGCTVVTDPAGDAAAVDAAPVPAEKHVDLVSADLSLSRGHLVATIVTAGLDANRQGEWRLELTAGGQRLMLGAGFGMWVNAGTWDGLGGYVAGRPGQRLTEVRGSVDYATSTIRIDAPVTVFGGVRLAPGTRVSDLALSARETFAYGPATLPAYSVHVGDVAAVAGPVPLRTC